MRQPLPLLGRGLGRGERRAPASIYYSLFPILLFPISLFSILNFFLSLRQDFLQNNKWEFTHYIIM